MKPALTLFACILLLLPFTSCVSRSNPFPDTETGFDADEPKSPEELRMELKAAEEADPLQYISKSDINLDPRQVMTRSGGLFREAEYAPDGAVISGSFHNAATLARFKDVELKLSFYSQTNTLIDEQAYVIYEYLEPNASAQFSFKIDSYPEAMDYFEAEIVGASVAE